MFQTLPAYHDDPLTNCQMQLATFVKAGLPEFDGFQGLLAVNRQIKAIKNTFYLLGIPEELQVPFTAHRLTGIALTWRETIGYSFDIQTITWDVFERLFKDNYYNIDHRQSKAGEFEALYQGCMTVTNYYNQFIDLASYA